MTEKIHWLDEAATARANNNEVDIAWCGDADYPGSTIRRSNFDAVTCATCKRLVKRSGDTV